MSCPQHLLSWMQSNTCSCLVFSPDRSRLLWFHLYQVYLDWVKLGRSGSLLGPWISSQPSPCPTVEGRDSCSASALERGERRAQLFSVHKDFSYVSIRLQWAPNIAQLTSEHRPRLAAPPPGCCMWTNHKGQGPVPCDPLIPFEVHTPNLGDNLLCVWNANYEQQRV